MTGVSAQQHDHLSRLLRLVFQRHFRPGGNRSAIRKARIFSGSSSTGPRYPPGRLNGAARHAVELGRRRVLHQRHAASLDGAQTSVPSNHAESITPMLCCCWSCARSGGTNRWAGAIRAAPPARTNAGPMQDRHVPVGESHSAVRRTACDLDLMTFMPVARWSSCAMMPLCVGSRCWTMTNAIRCPPARAGECSMASVRR